MDITIPVPYKKFGKNTLARDICILSKPNNQTLVPIRTKTYKTRYFFRTLPVTVTKIISPATFPNLLVSMKHHLKMQYNPLNPATLKVINIADAIKTNNNTI